MATVKDVTKILFGIALLFGIILTGISSTAIGHIGKDCDNNSIRGSWLTVLAMGTVMLTSSITFIMCMVNTGECSGLNKITNIDKAGKLLLFLGLVVSLLLIILSVLLVGNTNKHKYTEKCGGRTTKGSAIMLLIVSILSFLGFSGGIYYLNKLKINYI